MAPNMEGNASPQPRLDMNNNNEEVRIELDTNEKRSLFVESGTNDGDNDEKPTNEYVLVSSQ